MISYNVIYYAKLRKVMQRIEKKALAIGVEGPWAELMHSLC